LARQSGEAAKAAPFVHLRRLSMPGSTTISSQRRPSTSVRRRLPVGAEYLGDGRVDFRIWAPGVSAIAVVFEAGASISLQPEADHVGYFSGEAVAQPGAQYRFRLNGDDRLYPDPVSRYQPEGPHGPSVVIDPSSFRWTDAAWRGVSLEGQVIYELHIGTFTREGTWGAAERQLPELARVGITLLEVMPVAEFEGRFGWGYDGVDLYAPSHLYGHPDDFRRFVDAAHASGMGVILDVVYNHLGPVGNYLRAFSPHYFSDRYDNDWGEALNFDDEHSAPVRELFVSNAGYWIDEFHLDGLRLDATQQIYDQSPEHVLTAIGQRARAAANGRSIVIVAENEPEDPRLLRPIDKGGYGLDAMWNDDFHHSAMVAITGRGEAYYTDTRGEPQEFISALKYGFLFQGQYYHWQRDVRGAPALHLPQPALVTFLQNHDQVANSARGLRGPALTSPGRWRAMTALLLLGPNTPLLFQGQEFNASAPFMFFADFEAELAVAVRKGRGEFLMQFPSVAPIVNAGLLDDPKADATFERCRIDFAERETHSDAYALHVDLLRLRREEAAFRAQGRYGLDGCVLSASAFALRFFTPDHTDDRVLVVNVGADVDRTSIPDPLLAPPAGSEWSVRWSSEDLRYGGGGTPEIQPDSQWFFPSESAIVLAPGPLRRVRPSLVKPRRGV
jgi:maltooligosyltrehalose trehalohydrolase